VLRLVMLTSREILALLPRFRIMAVSMERLEITLARIASITIDVINLNAVVMVEAQHTRRTAPVLLFEQCGQAWTDTRMPSASRAPIHPVTIIGTTIVPDFAMSCNGHLTMRAESHGFRVRRRSGTGETGLSSMPVAFHGLRPKNSNRLVSRLGVRDLLAVDGIHPRHRAVECVRPYSHDAHYSGRASRPSRVPSACTLQYVDVWHPIQSGQPTSRCVD